MLLMLASWIEVPMQWRAYFVKQMFLIQSKFCDPRRLKAHWELPRLWRPEQRETLSRPFCFMPTMTFSPLGQMSFGNQSHSKPKFETAECMVVVPQTTKLEL
jgi:hypothetical protein